MSETDPLCARVIIDEIDERFRSEVDDSEIIGDLKRATIRAITRKTPTHIKAGEINCQVDNCSASCRIFESSDGLFMTLSLNGEGEPVSEEQCFKISSGR